MIRRLITRLGADARLAPGDECSARRRDAASVRATMR